MTLGSVSWGDCEIFSIPTKYIQVWQLAPWFLHFSNMSKSFYTSGPMIMAVARNWIHLMTASPIRCSCAPVPHFHNSSPLVTHVCVGELGQHWFGSWLVACSAPSITLTNADLLSIGPLWMNVCEILIEIQIFSMKKMHMKIAPGKMCFYWGGEYKVYRWQTGKYWPSSRPY